MDIEKFTNYLDQHPDEFEWQEKEHEGKAGMVLEVITNLCLSSKSTNPLEMANTIMKHPKIHMIGHEHHPMIAGVLVAAYRNLISKIGDDEIREAIKRGHTIPGGYCCKRSTWVALETAIQYFREVLKVEMGYIPASQIRCEHSHRNSHCCKVNCRFYPV